MRPQGKESPILLARTNINDLLPTRHDLKRMHFDNEVIVEGGAFAAFGLRLPIVSLCASGNGVSGTGAPRFVPCKKRERWNSSDRWACRGTDARFSRDHEIDWDEQAETTGNCKGAPLGSKPQGYERFHEARTDAFLNFCWRLEVLASHRTFCRRSRRLADRLFSVQARRLGKAEKERSNAHTSFDR